MTKRILAAIMAFVLILSCVPALQVHAADASPNASGTTYYVSSLHGAEGNNGTSQDKPFASLLKINEITLQPGDRVLLERGSVFVDEYLHIKGSGSKDAPIIIDVYGDDNLPKPLIQTNGKGIWYQDYEMSLDNRNHQYQGDVSSCILLFDVEYIEISNIAMTNEGNFKAGEVYNTARRMDRTGVAGVAKDKGTVDHIYLKNLDIRNVVGNVYNKHMCNGGIYLVCHKPTDVNATGKARYDDVLIEGCRLDEVNRWGIAVGYTAHWEGFPYAIDIPDEAAIENGSTNVVIRNNYLTNVGGDGITTMYCYRPLIEYNVVDGYAQDMVSSIYQYPENRGGMVAAGIWPWMCKTPIFQYNECYNSTYNQDGQAWDADWGDNTIYQYNYSCNNAGGAVMCCGSYASHTVFRYNISQNDLAGVINHVGGTPNGKYYNNVFYIKEGVKIHRDGMSGGRANLIANNIFYYTGSTPADASLGNWNATTVGLYSNNVYYNYASLPNDANAITADPLFVDPGKGPTGAQENGLIHDLSAFEGYKLQAGSPAIDAGMPIENIDAYYNGGKDFFGNDVDLIPDIGAYDAGTCTADAEKALLVSLELGESVTLSDFTGDFSSTTPSMDNEKIASVEMKGGTSTIRTHSDAVTTLADGKYLLVNNRAGKPMTNQDAASQQGEAGAMNGLSLNGTIDNISDNAVWTITASGSGYTVQDANGKYLSISNNDANMVDGASVVNIVYSDGTWTLMQNGAYLNDAANKGVCASGWDGDGYYNAATDAGSLWTIYPVVEETANSTELTFTGKFPGTAQIIVGDTLYLVRVMGQVEEVDLKVGETVTFTDETGNYTNADTSSLDTEVATVTLAGAMTEGAELGSSVTSLVSGGKYILVNTRAGKPVTNAPATAAAAAGAGSGLNLNGTKENLEDIAIWTITGSNGSYTVQDKDGKYMTVSSKNAGLSTTSNQVNLNYNGSTWTISQNGAYLNQFGGASSTCAAGWQDNAAATDSGSQWEIYEVNYTSGENGTQITFTGIGNGETYVLIGDIMYDITVTGGPCRHTKYTNGFCTGCDAYQPAQLVDGVYQLGNAGNLYWFWSEIRSGNLAPDSDAALTDDITVNENIFVDGELDEDAEFRTWNGIGSNANKYTGTFDGQNHTIHGLYYNSDKTTASYRGLFAAIGPGAVVKNITLADSYISGDGEVGGIVGQNFGGTVENCHNTSYVGGVGSNIGGIVGQNFGTVIRCSNTGTVYGEGQAIGGVVGTNTSDGTDAATKNATVSQCFNAGSVERDNDTSEAAVGGVVGTNNNSTVINCYNAGSVYNKGVIAGGVVGKADRGTVENCHNVGSVSGKSYAGPIIGRAYNNPTVRNCYYLADAESDELDGTTAKTAAQFASGEVKDLLNGSAAEDEQVWKQTVDTDAYPKFSGMDVHTHDFDQKVVSEEYLASAADCEHAATYFFSCSCGEKGTEVFEDGEALGHIDTNPVDHKCDRCETALTECEDKNNDHKCDICEEVLTQCEDKNNDGKCDTCGKLLGIIRLAGEHRWNTAIKVADEMKANLEIEKFDAIIIASGNDFADALAGSYLSTVKNAPILLAWGQGGAFEFLDTDNINYIKANLAEDGIVYILGGEKAVPGLYEEALKDFTVKRLGGADRFETNLLILEEAGIDDGSEILVCTATNFADSLSASATGKPILLVFNNLTELIGKQPEFLAGLKDCTFTVIGGENAVSDKLAEAIGEYGKVERLAGDNRFETSVLVAQKYFENPETAVLAYALNYPDGLCGGSLAYSLKAPLILTMTGYEEAAAEYAKTTGITSGLVLGGDALISDASVRAIFAMDAADEIVVK